MRGIGSHPGRPTLDLIHTELPHVPWNYLPSGHEYVTNTKGVPGTDKDGWNADKRLIRQGEQRYLLQVGYVDTAARAAARPAARHRALRALARGRDRRPRRRVRAPDSRAARSRRRPSSRSRACRCSSRRPDSTAARWTTRPPTTWTWCRPSPTIWGARSRGAPTGGRYGTRPGRRMTHLLRVRQVRPGPHTAVRRVQEAPRRTGRARGGHLRGGRPRARRVRPRRGLRA